MRMAFSRHKQKFPSETAVICGYSAQGLYAIHISLGRCNVVVKVIENGRREVKNSLVRKSWMSQENVIKFWVALHPLFPNSYSV